MNLGDIWVTMLMGFDSFGDGLQAFFRNMPYYLSIFGRVFSTFASIISQLANLFNWIF